MRRTPKYFHKYFPASKHFINPRYRISIINTHPFSCKNRVENTPRRKYKTLLSYSRLYLFQLPLLRNACHREPHDPKPEDGVPGVALTRFLERSTTHNRGKSSSTRGFLPRSSSGRSFTVISREGAGVARKFESRGRPPQ